jgi:hypothetical protein
MELLTWASLRPAARRRAGRDLTGCGGYALIGDYLLRKMQSISTGDTVSVRSLLFATTSITRVDISRAEKIDPPLLEIRTHSPDVISKI